MIVMPIYNPLVVITELDAEWLEGQTKKLSALQRKLLAEGLRMHHYHRPVAIACGLPNPGCFRLDLMMSGCYKDRRLRASRRAAAGRAIRRLIVRGLLECCARGRWRLSQTGLAVTLALNPQAKPPSEEELAANIALRKAALAAGL